MLADIELNENILLSGGAQGADTEFGKAATKAKHQVAHWSFEGHKLKLKSNVHVLTKEQLLEAEPSLIIANKNLKRTYPTKSENSNNLLRRNYFQAKYASSVYAVTAFVDDSSLLKVAGGTAWACQMYIDRFLFEQEPWNKCKLFLFDQNTEKWYTWQKVWTATNQPLKPSGVYAGIGTRKLTNAGIAAITSLYQG